MALIYATKPDATGAVTVARSGATAIVVDTASLDDSGGVAPAIPEAATSGRTIVDSQTAISLPAGAKGSSSPPVSPADIDSLKKEGLIIPVAGVVPKDLVDSFDDKRGTERHHNALDIMAARNTPVLAALSGQILKLHNSTAGGLTIYESDPSLRYVMMYGHLESYRDGIKEGQRVNRGEIIGFVGSSGNANPLAPHLHFQVTRNDNLKEWWKGTAVNPFLVFRP